jgi:hypothetical protein
LPAALVDLRDGKCGKHKIVSQEFQAFVRFLIEIIDASQVHPDTPTLIRTMSE